MIRLTRSAEMFRDAMVRRSAADKPRGSSNSACSTKQSSANHGDLLPHWETRGDIAMLSSSGKAQGVGRRALSVPGAGVPVGAAGSAAGAAVVPAVAGCGGGAMGACTTTSGSAFGARLYSRLPRSSIR